MEFLQNITQKRKQLATLKQIGNLLDKSFSKCDYLKQLNLGNESQTRDYLIEPFFNLLGYDKWNTIHMNSV